MARFIRHLGAATYWNPRRWKTPDGVVPFQVFFILAGVLDNLEHGDTLQLARAAQLGAVAADNGKDGAVRAEFRKLERKAVPKIYPKDTQEGD